MKIRFFRPSPICWTLMLLVTQLPAQNRYEDWQNDSGEPANYCARTDTRVEPYAAKPPALGGAGSVITDPSFGSPILRVTDAESDPAGRQLSFATTASSQQNIWNANTRKFYVGAAGGRRVVYDFDPTRFAIGKHRLIDAPWVADPDFSFTRPDILYGVRYSHPAFQEYDTSTAQISILHRVSECLKLQNSDVAAGSVSISADDQRMSTVLGPGQDKNYVVYVYDRTLGCRWYNTQTGQVGGQWGPAGTISAPDRFSIHSSKMSRSGQFVWIDRGHSVVGKSWVVWEIGARNVTACPSFCSGHLAMGYSHIIGPSGEKHPLDLVTRPLGNLSSPTPILGNLTPLKGARYWFSGHISWNHLNRDDTTPACVSTFSLYNPSAPGAPLDAIVPGENEVMCLETDGKSETVWRFAHTYSTAKGGFWSTPRGNLSQDGKFFLFTSDWEKELGEVPGKGHRVDVFMVDLRCHLRNAISASVSTSR